MIPVVWPAGYRARLDPLDAAGAAVAVAGAGTVISVAGGLIPTDPPDQGSADEAFHVMAELPPL